MPSLLRIEMNTGTKSFTSYSRHRVISSGFCLLARRTHRRKSYLIVVGAIVFCLLVPVKVRGEDTINPEREVITQCAGSLYRAKRDDVPVYEEPSLESSVLRRLKQSEQVCYLGEQGDFIIIQKKSNQQSSEQSSGQDGDKSSVAFVRLVDVWEPSQGQVRTSFLKKTRQYMNYVLHGGVPDDPLFLVRPLIESVFSSSTDSLTCSSSPPGEEEACRGQ